MKIYMIHGWDGNSKYYNNLIKQLKGTETIALNMPDPEAPEIKKWINYMKKNIIIDDNTYFIGHSVGCQAILRFLANQDKKVKGIFLIAPWMHLDTQTIEEEGEEVKEIARPWMETPINFPKIKLLSKKITCIFSNDDPYVPLSDEKLFKKELGAKTIIREKLGHIDNISDINKEILEFLK
jgi:predicted alpha/beta hydrolase family esterase